MTSRPAPHCEEVRHTLAIGDTATGTTLPVELYVEMRNTPVVMGKAPFPLTPFMIRANAVRPAVRRP